MCRVPVPQSCGSTPAQNIKLQNIREDLLFAFGAMSRFLKPMLSRVRGLAGRFDSVTQVISLVGVLVTGVLILVVVIFEVQLSTYLKKIPFIDYVIDVSLIEEFEDVDEEDVFYVQLKGQLDMLVDDLDEIVDIKVRTDSSYQKTFRLLMADGTYRFVVVSKIGQGYAVMSQVDTGCVVKTGEVLPSTGDLVTGELLEQDPADLVTPEIQAIIDTTRRDAYRK